MSRRLKSLKILNTAGNYKLQTLYWYYWYQILALLRVCMHIHACMCVCVFADFCERPNTCGLANYCKAAARFTKHIILASSSWEYAHSCACMREYVWITEYLRSTTQLHHWTAAKLLYGAQQTLFTRLEFECVLYAGCIFGVCVCVPPSHLQTA